mmetsp:Transcript_26191/g.39659  ORF Transcript_26191/g.39659 Transcript_26191/m.39659 type:complete len:330 (+) Transcript_26191:178-1167(+)|eukprot:CAMPEP_0178912972 /NCGR_PEP_ID=MMETSP0786-20121207/10575_1 /TAXON_ID=186022 /ORGANISM="Thalassionema frauenfeldii, Strain CCMP 1798" /LENGTH=329 /DNA_ID=CAMNT_0020585645 /DNA_START=78 /DNA_END=1067 /DNA_ORIENTATION=-
MICTRQGFISLNAKDAIMFNTLGNAHFDRENFDEAIDAYHHGLEIERTRLEPTHPNIIITLSNIAETYRQSGNFDLAIQAYQEVLYLQQQRFGSCHPDIAKTLHVIGLIYDQMGDLSYALECIKYALEQQQHMKSDLERRNLSAILTHAGCIFYRMNMLSTAMEYFDEALSIQRKKNDKKEIAFTLYNMGLCHQAEENYKVAIDCYSEALEHEEKILGKGHRDTSATLFKLGEVYSTLRMYDKALYSFQIALKIERQSVDKDEDFVNEARILIEIGYVHYFKGNNAAIQDTLNEISTMDRRGGLSQKNMILFKFLQTFGMTCQPAAPAA